MTAKMNPRKRPATLQIPAGTLRTQVRVRANGHTGTVEAMVPARKGVVVFIAWDEAEVALAAQRHGICWTTRPRMAHHRDVATLEILSN